jgi:hypothetical protein
VLHGLSRRSCCCGFSAPCGHISPSAKILTGSPPRRTHGGGIFGAVFLTASFCGINAGAFQIAGAGVDPLAVRGFYDFAGAFFAMSGIGFAVFSGRRH